MKLRVLMVEDSEDDALMVRRELKKGGFDLIVERVETDKDMRKALQNQKWDVIISDYVLPSFSGLDALKVLQKTDLDLPFIIVSGKIGEETAVEMMKAGAHDYIMKNNLSRLNPAIKRELEEVKVRLERQKIKEDLIESYSELEKKSAQLEKANIKLKGEIIKREKAEKQAVEVKEHLQNVINSASEIIISIDKNNRITTWNKTAELITGYKHKEVLNRSINKLSMFDNSQNVIDIVKTVYQEKKFGYDDLVLITKNNVKKIIRVIGSVIKGKYKQDIGILFVGTDITKDIEIHGKLLLGNSYLIPDKNNKVAVDLFIDLTRSEHQGLFFTRSNPVMIKSIIPPKFKIQVILLSKEKSEDYKNISDLDSLIHEIKEFSIKNNNAVILLDGIHYLLTIFSFEKFIEALYQINDLMAKNKSILLMRFDASLVDNNKMAIIENELQLLPSQKLEGLIIEDSVYNMLKFIHEQNQNNALVSFKKIMVKFKIAYSTAAKRLQILEIKGLIFTKRQGKLRTVYISEKGKTLLSKRQTA
ncbi:MAG: response regulator [Thermoplasmatales archaeon]|nr:MAG: response regulator [Thermoplasmatales archaeon]